MRNDGYDLEALLAAIDSNTRLVFIANPNNPTGTLIPPNELDRFIERLPAHLVLALDEAYFEFADTLAVLRHAPRSHAIEYVRQARNVVVLRTFSKAHGLAGLRIGYGMGPSEFMGYLARVKTAFMVSSVAEAAALAALEDGAHIDKTMRNNAEQVPWLLEQLRGLGYNPVETWANFIYCEVGENASDIGKRLQSEGVIVRPMTGGWGGPKAIRVSVGTPEENQRFIMTLKKLAKGQSA
jgi:histidinol-phosphate aminotransferase